MVDKVVVKFAKDHRKNSTNTEEFLWLLLKNRQLNGVKFRRQEPMGQYIADFVNHENKLVIELDGWQHYHSREKDVDRDAWFSSRGYTVLRFRNDEISDNRDEVLEAIRKQLLSPHLASSPARGEVK